MNIEYIRQQLEAANIAINNCMKELPPPSIIVRPGDNIQAIINNAKSGDVLKFIKGETYVTGSLNLANKSITLMSDDLPNRRINETDVLPLLTSGGLYPTINGTGAIGLTIIGLAFGPRSDGAGDIIVLDDANDVFFDRIRIIGGANGQKRAIRGNGENITLISSYIANIWKFQQDSQAFCAWNGAGPYSILDNYLEAAGEVILFGGADSKSEDNIPSNILISGNTLTKKLEWKEKKGFYSVKNILELKCARNVNIRSNILKRNWTDAQAGYSLVIKSENQNGTAPWSRTENVWIEDNILDEIENGINIQGISTSNPGGRTTNISFRNNLIKTPGVGLQMTGGVKDVRLEYNTFENGYTFINLDAKTGEFSVENLSLENILANHNQYGVKGSGTGIGVPSLNRYVNGLIWSNNALLGYSGKGSYPISTYNSLADVPAEVKVGRQ